VWGADGTNRAPAQPTPPVLADLRTVEVGTPAGAQRADQLPASGWPTTTTAGQFVGTARRGGGSGGWPSSAGAERPRSLTVLEPYNAVATMARTTQPR